MRTLHINMWCLILVLINMQGCISVSHVRIMAKGETCLDIVATDPKNFRKRLNCSTDPNSREWYHCLADQDNIVEYELCSNWKWIEKGKCAYYNPYGEGNVDERYDPCVTNNNRTCSSEQFESMYNTNYSGCYPLGVEQTTVNIISSTETEINPAVDPTKDERHTLHEALGITFGILICVPLLSILVFFLIKQMNITQGRDVETGDNNDNARETDPMLPTEKQLNLDETPDKFGTPPQTPTTSMSDLRKVIANDKQEQALVQKHDSQPSSTSDPENPNKANIKEDDIPEKPKDNKLADNVIYNGKTTPDIQTERTTATSEKYKMSSIEKGGSAPSLLDTTKDATDQIKKAMLDNKLPKSGSVPVLSSTDSESYDREKVASDLKELNKTQKSDLQPTEVSDTPGVKEKLKPKTEKREVDNQVQKNAEKKSDTHTTRTSTPEGDDKSGTGKTEIDIINKEKTSENGKTESATDVSCTAGDNKENTTQNNPDEGNPKLKTETGTPSIENHRIENNVMDGHMEDDKSLDTAQGSIVNSTQIKSGHDDFNDGVDNVAADDKNINHPTGIESEHDDCNDDVDNAAADDKNSGESTGIESGHDDFIDAADDKDSGDDSDDSEYDDDDVSSVHSWTSADMACINTNDHQDENFRSKMYEVLKNICINILKKLFYEITKRELGNLENYFSQRKQELMKSLKPENHKDMTEAVTEKDFRELPIPIMYAALKLSMNPEKAPKSGWGMSVKKEDKGVGDDIERIMKIHTNYTLISNPLAISKERYEGLMKTVLAATTRLDKKYGTQVSKDIKIPEETLVKKFVNNLLYRLWKKN